MSKDNICICEDPYRQNHKKIDGEIKDLKKVHTLMWEKISEKLTIKQFALTLTLLMTMTVSILSVTIYESNRTKRDLVKLVRQTRDDVLLIKSELKIKEHIWSSGLNRMY